MALTDTEIDSIKQAALIDSWARGCTCGSKPLVAVLQQEPPVRVGIEHLKGCPLWQDRDLDDLMLEQSPPDAIVDLDPGGE